MLTAGSCSCLLSFAAIQLSIFHQTLHFGSFYLFIFLFCFIIIFFFFQLLALGITIAHNLTLSLLCHTNLRFPSLHESSLWSSPFPPAWQLQYIHYSSPEHVQPFFYEFVSKSISLSCPSDVLISNLVHFGHD